MSDEQATWLMGPFDWHYQTEGMPLRLSAVLDGKVFAYIDRVPEGFSVDGIWGPYSTLREAMDLVARDWSLCEMVRLSEEMGLYGPPPEQPDWLGLLHDAVHTDVGNGRPANTKARKGKRGNKGVSRPKAANDARATARKRD